MRVAGSAGPDIMTSVNGKFIFFECKFTSKKVLYVSREDIQRELKVSKKMGARFFLAVKFGREKWRFIADSQLERFATGKSYRVRIEELSGLPMLSSLLVKNLNDYDKNRSEH